MPAYQTPKSFPGVDRLPGPLQGLVGSLFPKDQLPTPAIVGTPSGSSKALAWLQKALTKGGEEKVAQGGSNAVQGASQTIPQSIKDLLHPSAMNMQDKMYQETNPIFKRMQAMGMFNRGK